jgi:acyl-CoA synthetase (AMP-forming)/AMP-acid ligase II
MPHPDWGETVMAVVVLKEGEKLTLEELREFLKSRIADYKIPRMIEIMGALPRNVAGKVLKYQLRDQLKDQIKK